MQERKSEGEVLTVTDEKFRRIYAISDIHGDYEGLYSVYKQMRDDGMNLDQDLLVQLGDMVDGYTEVVDVVDGMKSLQKIHGDHVVVLLGNHEDMFARAIGKHEGQSDFRNWWFQGGNATYYSYMREESGDYERNHYYNNPFGPLNPTALMQEHLDWFASLPLSYEYGGFTFVHAGVNPMLGLQGSDKHDLLWIREPFHNSTMDFGSVIVYGHTAREEPLQERNKIGLDTRFRGKGYVSGARLLDGKILKHYKGI
jgi:serine/threonine protein phosphatase 1